MFQAAELPSLSISADLLTHHVNLVVFPFSKIPYASWCEHSVGEFWPGFEPDVKQSYGHGI